MYRLVIAEKPSVAMSIAKVLGATARKEGHMEGCGSPVATSKRQGRLEAPTEPTGETGWLVSWCIGHLAGLAEPAVYNPSYDKWRREDLPILPENWRFTIGKDKREQFDVLRTLLRREDVSEVVNACDAGREGELIFRTAYHLAGCTKPMRRLWISSMEDSAIREGFENLCPGQDYDGLHQAALCRQKADWLVGINATRLFSVLYGRTLNIGRVMSPTLALIVQREAEIAAFEPMPFYTVELDCGGVTLTRERTGSKEDALNGVPAQAQRSGLRGEKEGQRSEADARRQAGAAEWSLPRRGIGTPATRAAILEKLVATGLAERKKARKITNLLPTQAGSSLVTVLPEVLQSPLLTADWEQRLGEVERGELSPEDFMAGIAAMVDELVKTYQPVPSAAVLFPSGKGAVGPCPRCGGAVIESKKGFFCENRECRFVLWKDSKFFTAKKKSLTKTVAAALLNKGQVRLTGCFSEKTGKTYDATVVLEDDGERTNYKLVFDNG